MKRYLSLTAAVVVLCLLGSALALAAAPPSKFLGKQLFLRTNVWYETPERIFSTNYHQGSILPVGVEVMVKELTSKTITFVLTENNTAFIIQNVKRHNMNMTTEELADQYFSETDPLKEAGTFNGFSDEEKRNVRFGKVDKGMSREAVLMAYGYPPRRHTATLKSHIWIYWDTPKMKRIVYFDNDRVYKVVESK